MYNISHKYKRFLFLLVKLATVICAFYFIYKKLVSNHLLSSTELQQQFLILFYKNAWYLLILLLFTDANWLLEIYKWKILASIQKRLTFFEASQQSLASLTAAIITPNRIGEYGAKALYFEKKSRKKIVLLNLLGNISQLIVTTIFGLFGMVFFLTEYSLQVPSLNVRKLWLLIASLIVLFMVSKKLNFTKIGKIYLNKTVTFLKRISTDIYIKTLGLATLRYLVFSLQFYFLLKIFNIEAHYFTLMQLIFLVYFIASIIPNLTIFDWVIKGYVAVFVFSFIHLNELTIITITTIMWLLNFAIPALLGSIFVLNFKYAGTP